ncbi:hypothetical protein [Streptomyces sp. NPDC101165]|uniref:hypothetical protein n=1 Tax=Streptomyces sp. NPDC101165 TaxID=3366119 RepID=UPI003806A946
MRLLPHEYVPERKGYQAVACFGGGHKNGEIAAALRVGERSVERWHVKHDPDNLVAADLSETTPAVKHRLKKIRIARTWSRDTS